MASDILPFGYEVGLLDADAREGLDILQSLVAGPVGLAAILSASLFPRRLSS